jgi:hypothetical protein
MRPEVILCKGGAIVAMLHLPQSRHSHDDYALLNRVRGGGDF